MEWSVELGVRRLRTKLASVGARPPAAPELELVVIAFPKLL